MEETVHITRFADPGTDEDLYTVAEFLDFLDSVDPDTLVGSESSYNSLKAGDFRSAIAGRQCTQFLRVDSVAEKICPYRLTPNQLKYVQRYQIPHHIAAEGGHGHAEFKAVENVMMLLEVAPALSGDVLFISSKPAKFRLMLLEAGAKENPGSRLPRQYEDDAFNFSDHWDFSESRVDSAYLCHPKLTVKDDRRFPCHLPLPSPARFAPTTIFLHDVLHFKTHAEIAQLFKQYPTLQRVYATAFLPIEVVHRVDSLFPANYRISYVGEEQITATGAPGTFDRSSSEHFTVHLGENRSDTYEQPLWAVEWLQTREISYGGEGGERIGVEKLVSFGPQHLFLFTRDKENLTHENHFDSPDVVLLPRLDLRDPINKQPFFPLETYRQVFLHARALGRERYRETEAFAKLRSHVSSDHNISLEQCEQLARLAYGFNQSADFAQLDLLPGLLARAREWTFRFMSWLLHDRSWLSEEAYRYLYRKRLLWLRLRAAGSQAGFQFRLPLRVVEAEPLVTSYFGMGPQGPYVRPTPRPEPRSSGLSEIDESQHLPSVPPPLEAQESIVTVAPRTPHVITDDLQMRAKLKPQAKAAMQKPMPKFGTVGGPTTTSEVVAKLTEAVATHPQVVSRRTRGGKGKRKQVAPPARSPTELEASNKRDEVISHDVKAIKRDFMGDHACALASGCAQHDARDPPAECRTSAAWDTCDGGHGYWRLKEADDKLCHECASHAPLLAVPPRPISAPPTIRQREPQQDPAPFPNRDRYTYSAVDYVATARSANFRHHVPDFVEPALAPGGEPVARTEPMRFNNGVPPGLEEIEREDLGIANTDLIQLHVSQGTSALPPTLTGNVRLPSEAPYPDWDCLLRCVEASTGVNRRALWSTLLAVAPAHSLLGAYLGQGLSTMHLHLLCLRYDWRFRVHAPSRPMSVFPIVGSMETERVYAIRWEMGRQRNHFSFMELSDVPDAQVRYSNHHFTHAFGAGADDDAWTGTFKTLERPLGTDFKHYQVSVKRAKAFYNAWSNGEVGIHFRSVVEDSSWDAGAVKGHLQVARDRPVKFLLLEGAPGSAKSHPTHRHLKKAKNHIRRHNFCAAFPRVFLRAATKAKFDQGTALDKDQTHCFKTWEWALTNNTSRTLLIDELYLIPPGWVDFYLTINPLCTHIVALGDRTQAHWVPGEDGSSLRRENTLILQPNNFQVFGHLCERYLGYTYRLPQVVARRVGLPSLSSEEGFIELRESYLPPSRGVVLLVPSGTDVMALTAGGHKVATFTMVQGLEFRDIQVLLNATALEKVCIQNLWTAVSRASRSITFVVPDLVDIRPKLESHTLVRELLSYTHPTPFATKFPFEFRDPTIVLPPLSHVYGAGSPSPDDPTWQLSRWIDGRLSLLPPSFRAQAPLIAESLALDAIPKAAEPNEPETRTHLALEPSYLSWAEFEPMLPREAKERLVRGLMSAQFTELRGKLLASRELLIFPTQSSSHDPTLFWTAVEKRLRFASEQANRESYEQKQSVGMMAFGALSEFLTLPDCAPEFDWLLAAQCLVEAYSKVLDKPINSLLNNVERADPDWAPNYMRAFVKSQLKAKEESCEVRIRVSDNAPVEPGMLEAKAGQIIVESSYFNVITFGWTTRYMRRMVERFAPKNIYFHGGKKISDLDRFARLYASRQPGSTCDFTAYDQSCTAETTAFEMALFRGPASQTRTLSCRLCTMTLKCQCARKSALPRSCGSQASSERMTSTRSGTARTWRFVFTWTLVAAALFLVMTASSFILSANAPVGHALNDTSHLSENSPSLPLMSFAAGGYCPAGPFGVPSSSPSRCSHDARKVVSQKRWTITSSRLSSPMSRAMSSPSGCPRALRVVNVGSWTFSTNTSASSLTSGWPLLHVAPKPSRPSTPSGDLPQPSLTPVGRSCPSSHKGLNKFAVTFGLCCSVARLALPPCLKTCRLRLLPAQRRSTTTPSLATTSSNSPPAPATGNSSDTSACAWAACTLAPPRKSSAPSVSSWRTSQAFSKLWPSASSQNGRTHPQSQPLPRRSWRTASPSRPQNTGPRSNHTSLCPAFPLYLPPPPSALSSVPHQNFTFGARTTGPVPWTCTFTFGTRFASWASAGLIRTTQFTQSPFTRFRPQHRLPRAVLPVAARPAWALTPLAAPSIIPRAAAFHPAARTLRHHEGGSRRAPPVGQLQHLPVRLRELLRDPVHPLHAADHRRLLRPFHVLRLVRVRPLHHDLARFHLFQLLSLPGSRSTIGPSLIAPPCSISCLSFLTTPLLATTTLLSPIWATRASRFLG
jgi:hypothetical protein